MRFQVGDVVRISKQFGDLVGRPKYPRNRDGVIERVNDNHDIFPIKVKFPDVDYSNDDYSVFKEIELKLVRRT